MLPVISVINIVILSKCVINKAIKAIKASIVIVSFLLTIYSCNLQLYPNKPTML